jgi:CxxC-x17-CxxC domain-containing protein
MSRILQVDEKSTIVCANWSQNLASLSHRVDGAHFHLLGVPARRAVFRWEPSSMSADITLTCRDCGQAFTYTTGEQDFYASRGFSEPGRCQDCRAARKAQRDGGSSGGYVSYGGGRGGREMFSATCSGCGQEAQVPFEPRGDKPVYCSACFEQRGGGNRSGGYGRSRY